MRLINDVDYKNFVRTGKIGKHVLIKLASKIKTGQRLSSREQSVYIGNSVQMEMMLNKKSKSENGLINDVEYKNFVRTGKIGKHVLIKLVSKVRTGQRLSSREQSIYISNSVQMESMLNRKSKSAIGIINDEDYKKFVTTGKIAKRVLIKLGSKIKTGQRLSIREQSVYIGNSVQMESILRK
jgi:hypothetical protein